MLVFKMSSDNIQKNPSNMYSETSTVYRMEE